MKLLLRHTRLTILVTLLTLSGLTLAVGPVTAAHANSQPSITATGYKGGIAVGGSNFTPNGNVLVKVFYSDGKLEAKWHTTALGQHAVCRTFPIGPLCYLDPGGQINTERPLGPGIVRVIAYDYTSHTWSNRTTADIYPIP
jgi:hypothetical protein